VRPDALKFLGNTHVYIELLNENFKVPIKKFALRNKAFIKELIRESEEAKQPVGKIIQNYQLHLQVSKKSLNNFITKIKAKVSW